MRVIFLDFDGPMIPGRCYFMKNARVEGIPQFDPVAVGLVNRLAEKSKAKIVIHSNWRKGYYKGDVPLRDWIISQGLDPKHFHEDFFAPQKLSSDRFHDIQMWISDHPELKEFVILEDVMLSIGYERWLPNFVHIDYMEGFTWERYIKALDIFGEVETIL
jgi:hypothetical protein